MRSKNQNILGFQCVSILFRYLGATVRIDKLRVVAFEHLISKVKVNISIWKV